MGIILVFFGTAASADVLESKKYGFSISMPAGWHSTPDSMGPALAEELVWPNEEVKKQQIAHLTRPIFWYSKFQEPVKGQNAVIQISVDSNPKLNSLSLTKVLQSLLSSYSSVNAFNSYSGPTDTVIGSIPAAYAFVLEDVKYTYATFHTVREIWLFRKDEYVFHIEIQARRDDADSLSALRAAVYSMRFKQ